MSKLGEAIVLLNLPLEAENGEVTLAQASGEIYATAARTEALLQKLGLSRLTNYETRCILQRRVEAND